MGVEDKLKGIDFPNSYLMNVIYDDESLTLEFDYALEPEHPKYSAPNAGDTGCFRPGFIRFADITDLRLAKSAAGESGDLSRIRSAECKGDHVALSSGWGEVEVSARSIRVAVD